MDQKPYPPGKDRFHPAKPEHQPGGKTGNFIKTLDSDSFAPTLVLPAFASAGLASDAWPIRLHPRLRGPVGQTGLGDRSGIFDISDSLRDYMGNPALDNVACGAQLDYIQVQAARSSFARLPAPVPTKNNTKHSTQRSI